MDLYGFWGELYGKPTKKCADREKINIVLVCHQIDGIQKRPISHGTMTNACDECVKEELCNGEPQNKLHIRLGWTIVSIFTNKICTWFGLVPTTNPNHIQTLDLLREEKTTKTILTRIQPSKTRASRMICMVFSVHISRQLELHLIIIY